MPKAIQKIIILLLFLIPMRLLAQRQSLVVNCTFDNNSVTPLVAQTCCGFSQKFETDTTRFNMGTAYRFHLNRTDPLNHGGIRSELSGSAVAEKEGWYGYSFFVPHTFVPDTLIDLITQFHNVLPDTASDSSTPPMVLRIQNDHYYVQIQWSATTIGTTHDGSIIQDLGPVTKDVWVDWVWHIKWSYLSDGIVQLWKNGVKVIDRTGPNCFNDGHSPYFKCGEYKPQWRTTFTKGITSRDIYFDDIRISTAAGNYNSVAPGIDTPFISSFTPMNAIAGKTVTITGVSFLGTTAVSLGGVPAASYTVVSATQITAIVGANATVNGNVSVTNHGITNTIGGFSSIPLQGSISGGTALCLNAPAPSVVFTGAYGTLPYKFTYTINNGPQKIISSTATNPAAKVSAPTTVVGNFVYTLLSVTDKTGSTQTLDTSITVIIKAKTTSSTPVTICSTALPYSWNGQSYTKAGTYVVHLSNAANCDSAATLVLTVAEPTTSNIPVTVCSTALPYHWNGVDYAAAGSYTIHLTNAAGCDSAATLVLTVANPTISSTPVTVCSTALHYHWNGADYNTAGSYTIHLSNAAGCDSAATLVLTVTSPTTSNTPVTICSPALPYNWNGTDYSAAGNYTVHLTNAAGCDSAATLALTVISPTTSSTPVTICSSALPYNWNGTDYSASGSYTIHLTNAAGCDSAATLVLTVTNPTSSTTPVTVCQSALPYNWNGTDYSTPGSYTIHLTNAAGCDSAATLVLTVATPTASSTPVTVCSTALPYNWNGTDYSTAGSYTIHLNNSAGCDSAATLVLTIANPTTSSTSVTVCSASLPYSWNGNNYLTSGTYTVHLNNAAGCDSAATLVLTVNASISSTPVTVCQSALPYNWNGTDYSAAGSYTVHLTNAAGCDSAATLVLTVLSPTASSTPVTICQSSLPYNWNGTDYSAPGSYTVHLTNAAGCDSAATLVLTVATPTTSTTPVTVCSSALPYNWNGTDYTEAGSYTIHLPNAGGCDSTATLVLTVANPTTSSTPVTVCSSSLPYNWNGVDYTAAGSYTVHLSNTAGCDSAATLVLTVTNSTSSSTPVTVCPSALPYNWNGVDYSESGSYTIHLNNAAGCDSAATLVLTVASPTTSSTPVTVCQSALPYNWNGVDYSESGSYTIHLNNAAGCDSAATLVLTVASPTTSSTLVTVCSTALPYNWNGTDYSAAGSYTIHLNNTAGCDSAATLVLTVAEPTTSTTTVTVNSTDLPYLWNNNAYSSAGSYTVHFTNAAGCDSAATLALTVNELTTINSVSNVSTSPATSADSVQYAITFGEAITGLTKDNFSLTTTGQVGGASIGSITGSGNSYIVTVGTGTGDGTIELDVANATGISPGISSALPFAGQPYTVDKTPPTVSISPPSINSTNSGPVDFTVTWADTNLDPNTINLSPGNVTLNTTGTAMADSVSVFGSGNNYTVRLNNIHGSGTLGISIPEGTAADIAGNQAAAAGPSATVDILSKDALLSGLSTNTGTLSPLFTSAVNDYAVEVDNTVAGINVTPVADDANASITVNDVAINSGSASDNIPLTVGINNIIVKVTAQDGATINTYTITVTRDASHDASLANLTVNNSSLMPVFNTGTTSYSVIVTNGTTSIKTIPTANNTNATITVNGNTVASGSLSGGISLSIGDNIITVVVLAQDGTTANTYTIDVLRPSGNATLSSLTVSDGTLTPAFSPSTASYKVAVAYTTTSILLSSSTTNINASVTINDSTTNSGSLNVPLAVGSNIFKAVVKAQDGTLKTYTVTVTRAAPSGDANLAALVPGNGTLSPVFIGSTNNYKDTVSNATTTIQVTPTTDNIYGTVTVNKIAVVSGSPSNPISLAVGNNTIKIAVTSQSGTSKTYSIVVTRLSSNANLSALAISSGTLTPVFAQSTTNYATTVTNTTTSMQVTPTASNIGSKISVNGSAVASGSVSQNIPLSAGINTIQIAVTAQDGTLKTYTLTVTRPASTDDNLAALTIGGVTISPAFGPGKTKYTANVPNTTPAIQVTPTANDINSTVTVNETPVVSGSPSDNIPLSVGVNSIRVQVKAQSGATKTYTVTITRAVSTNNNLAALAVDNGTITPAFGPAKLKYTASVANTITILHVTPVAQDSTAVITVNGVIVISGTPSGDIPLVVGVNTISTKVVAASGVTKTYVLTVTRALSANNYLSSLGIDSGTITPAFGPAKLNYTANVANAVTTLHVTPTAQDNTATITVNGVAVATGSTSGDIALATGANTITTQVVAASGAARTYTLTVTRALSTNNNLATLVIDSGTVTPTFGPLKLNYTANVSNATTVLHLTPTAQDNTATITVNGTAVISGATSGDIALTVGSNTIRTVVTAASGAAKTYTLTVTRAAGTSFASTILDKPVSFNCFTSPSTTNVKVYSSSLPYSWNGNNYTAAGSYSVHLMTSIGCDSTANLVLNVIEGNPNGVLLTVNVYPNPTLTQFSLKIINGDNNSTAKVTIRNLQGRIVYQNTGGVKDTYTFGQNFGVGIYMAEVVNGKYTRRVKLIKATN